MAKHENGRATALFFGLWSFVIFVSVIDGYLALRHQQVMAHLELNPIGRMLVRLNGGQVWILLAAKFVGTVVACAAVLLIHRTSARLGLIVAGGLACAQLGLLMFLLLA